MMRRRTIPTIVAALLVSVVISGCDSNFLSSIQEQVEFSRLDEYTLTVVESAVGTVTPTGTIPLKDGTSVEVQAVEAAGFPFVRWEQINGSGTAVFEDPESDVTTVTLSGGDATIQAIWDDSVDPSGSVAVESLINISGTDYRNNRTVDLTLTYTDNSGSVPWMKLSDSSFATGTTTGWEASALSTTYMFTSDGPKTIYARFRDESGNESPLYSANVYIDTAGPTLGWFDVRETADSTSTPGTNYRDYVTGITSSDLVLLYDANDAGSGVGSVYFSNSSTRPASPQVASYTEPTAPYAWQIQSNNYVYQYGGDHTIYMWFEDRLGNISGPFTDTVRYDDNYETRWGNNTVDAVSGATLIMDGSADRSYQNLGQFTGNGSTYLIDPDVYKFGFDGDAWDAQITFWWNTTGPDPRVRFYYYDWNAGDVAQISPGTPVDPPGSNDAQYTFSFPAQSLGPYQYYYFYIVIDRTTAAPYAEEMNYLLWWEFQYVGI